MVTHTIWTEAEIELLKREYPTIGRLGIYELLPYRSHKSIDSKANRLELIQNYENRFSRFGSVFLANLTEPVKAYIAGFFDGEGTIGTRTRKRPYKTTNPNHQLFVSCTNTNEPVVHYLHSIFEGNLFYKTDTRGKRRPILRWTLQSAKAMQFLSYLLPYLIVKRDEAIIAIKLQTTYEHTQYIVSPEVIKRRNFYASELTRLKGRLH
mgnify:FL=1